MKKTTDLIIFPLILLIAGIITKEATGSWALMWLTQGLMWAWYLDKY